ncbi:hypothetical protein PMYN1_Chma499 (chromatophore) [Paulinella micropora]|uniref:Uncharacterized protein n=1 Tax=Paulinella micropora TaxID=1928728 RepID=A0A5K7VU83_9EUKA|nr:hypothetical protein PMYN1_Chma499 [Paulinella micropora]
MGLAGLLIINNLTSTRAFKQLNCFSLLELGVPMHGTADKSIGAQTNVFAFELQRFNPTCTSQQIK